MLMHVMPPQSLHVKKPQGGDMLFYGAGGKATVAKQVNLIFANLVRAQPIGRTAEVFREPLNDLDIGSYGILSVVATLEFLQHHLS
jgi:hypothetical protein